jgi:hypothetical protein
MIHIYLYKYTRPYRKVRHFRVLRRRVVSASVVCLFDSLAIDQSDLRFHIALNYCFREAEHIWHASVRVYVCMYVRVYV